MSLKLHGMPLSNYYNMVKTVLLEKGMDFEEVVVKPNQEEGYLEQSPMGKVPCLETNEGFLTETSVIINYIDALGEGPSFYPASPYQRAKVEELIHYMELYIELPARRLYGEVFFGKEPNEALREEVRAQLEKGFKALARIARFEPYIAGNEITYADFFFRFSINLATVVAKKALSWDAFNEIENIKPLLALMDERESVQRAMADQQAGD